VKVGVGRASRTVVVDAAGSAATTLTAPRPNRRYAVAAQQSGAGCAVQQARTIISVVGPYITGPARATKGADVTFRGRAFRADRAVAWQITRGGKTVASASVAASKRGISAFSVALPSAGRYAITAVQGGVRARYTVVAR
jgi:hypothetical protein